MVHVGSNKSSGVRVVISLIPRVSHLAAPWSERRGKMRDPGNEV